MFRRRIWRGWVVKEEIGGGVFRRRRWRGLVVQEMAGGGGEKIGGEFLGGGGG